MFNESIPENEPFKDESVECRKCIDINSEELPSIITIFFDQFNLKGLIKSIFQKTPLKTTDKFIDAALLFIFLLYLFYSLDLLKFKLSWYTGLLVAIGIGAVLEFVVANTSYIVKIFPTDARTKNFLYKVPIMTKKEIKEGIQNTYFSSKCMNLYLESIQEKHNKYPSYFIDLIIDNQVLRKENLNVLFSPNVIKYIRPEIIIKICAEYRDSLTYENIQNVYLQYKNDENVIKTLFATQNDSYFLIQNSGEKKDEKNQLNELYINYQVDKKHLDAVLKIIPMSNFRTIRNKLFWFLLVVSYTLFMISLEYGIINTPILVEVFIAYLVGLFIFAALIIVFIIDPIIRKVQDFYHKRLINNIIIS